MQSSPSTVTAGPPPSTARPSASSKETQSSPLGPALFVNVPSIEPVVDTVGGNPNAWHAADQWLVNVMLSIVTRLGVAVVSVQPFAPKLSETSSTLQPNGDRFVSHPP